MTTAGRVIDRNRFDGGVGEFDLSAVGNRTQTHDAGLVVSSGVHDVDHQREGSVVDGRIFENDPVTGVRSGENALDDDGRAITRDRYPVVVGGATVGPERLDRRVVDGRRAGSIVRVAGIGGPALRGIRVGGSAVGRVLLVGPVGRAPERVFGSGRTTRDGDGTDRGGAYEDIAARRSAHTRQYESG